MYRKRFRPGRRARLLAAPLAALALLRRGVRR